MSASRTIRHNLTSLYTSAVCTIEIVNGQSIHIFGQRRTVLKAHWLLYALCLISLVHELEFIFSLTIVSYRDR